MRKPESRSFGEGLRRCSSSGARRDSDAVASKFVGIAPGEEQAILFFLPRAIPAASLSDPFILVLVVTDYIKISVTLRALREIRLTFFIGSGFLGVGPFD